MSGSVPSQRGVSALSAPSRTRTNAQRALICARSGGSVQPSRVGERRTLGRITKMRARALGQLWVALLRAGPALPAVAAPCDGLLADGVVDRAHVNNTLELASRVSGWFCAKHFRSHQEAPGATREARLPVDDLLIPFGLHKDRKNFSQAYRSFCDSATP